MRMEIRQVRRTLVLMRGSPYLTEGEGGNVHMETHVRAFNSCQTWQLLRETTYW